MEYQTFETMEITFKKVHTTKDLVISAILVAAGIGLYFLTAGLGLLLAVSGLLMLIFYKAGYKCQGENILLKKYAMDIPRTCRDSIKEFLEGKNVEPKICKDDNGAVVRLEVYCNAARSVAYAQLFDFENYAYVPLSGIVELRGPRADNLIRKLRGTN